MNRNARCVMKMVNVKDNGKVEVLGDLLQNPNPKMGLKLKRKHLLTGWMQLN